MEVMLDKRHIVLVDDNKDILSTMESYLSLMAEDVNIEVDITPFRSGQALMASLLRGNFPHIDLILMDFDMPGMNGAEVTQIVRQRGKTDTMIVFVSAFDDDGRKEVARKAGANAYSSKLVTEGADQRVMMFLNMAKERTPPKNPPKWLTVFNGSRNGKVKASN